METGKIWSLCSTNTHLIYNLIVVLVSFRIALRHITHNESDIELSLQSLKENGFINYYGLQRFGNNSTVPTHQVGLALIKGQFKEVGTI